MLCWQSFGCCSKQRSDTFLNLGAHGTYGLDTAGTALAVFFFLCVALGSTAVKLDALLVAFVFLVLVPHVHHA
jgi:hypothetical protein